MIALTIVGTVGVLFNGPFIAVAIYYLFAVLRPQAIWEWALPQYSWSQYVAIAAIVGLAGTSLGFLQANGDTARPRWSRAHWTYLAFGVWISLTYLTAYSKAVAGIWFIEYLKIFLMFSVAACVVATIKQVQRIYLVATAALLYIAYEVNVLYLVDGRLDIYKNGYGGLDNNGAALMLAMGVPMSIYAWEALTSRWRWVFLAGLPVFLHAVLMTYSRGAMLSLLVATPLLIVRSTKRKQFSLAALALAALVPVLAGQEIRARFSTLQQVEEDESANSRLGSWKAAFDIANDHPIFGVGIRNSNLFSQSYGADMEGRTIHSQYLQTLADSGYVGLALYLCALCGSVFSLRHVRKAVKGRDDPEAQVVRSLSNGLEGAFAVFCFGAAFLSLEVFELPYVIGLLSCQLWAIVRAQSAAATVPAPESPAVPVSPFGNFIGTRAPG
jgi:probable O-glycosylation ligase (exosortase A-associated)